MKKQENEVIEWIKTHRRQLVIAGISAVSIALVYLGIRNRETIKSALESLRDSNMTQFKQTTAELETVSMMSASETTKELVASTNIDLEQLLIDIRMHFRNLPSGWQASAKKIAEAESLGIPLSAGQTLVDGYKKRRAAV